MNSSYQYSSGWEERVGGKIINSAVYQQVITDGIYRPVEAWMDFGSTLDFAGGLLRTITPTANGARISSRINARINVRRADSAVVDPPPDHRMSIYPRQGACSICAFSFI